MRVPPSFPQPPSSFPQSPHRHSREGGNPLRPCGLRLGISATRRSTPLWFSATLPTRPIYDLERICRAHLYVLICPLPIVCRLNPATGGPVQSHVLIPPAPLRVEYIPVWVTPNPPFVSTVIIFEYLHREPPFDVSARHLLCWETWMSSLYLLSLLPRNGTHGDTAGEGGWGKDPGFVG